MPSEKEQDHGSLAGVVRLDRLVGTANLPRQSSQDRGAKLCDPATESFGAGWCRRNVKGNFIEFFRALSLIPGDYCANDWRNKSASHVSPARRRSKDCSGARDQDDLLAYKAGESRHAPMG